MQPFGATNEPDTCLWCGRKLRHGYITKREVTDEKPRRCTAMVYRNGFDERCDSRKIDRDERGAWRCDDNHFVDRVYRVVSREQWTETPGYRQSGLFCTLECGWSFGVNMAKLGKRLEPPKRVQEKSE